MSGLLGESLKAYPWGAATKTTAATASTAAVAIGGTGFYIFGVEGSTSDGAFVIFGDSTVAAASASNGVHIAAGEKIERYVDGVRYTHFRVIRKTADEVFFHVKTGD
jgi:hypothetical protein